MTERNVALRANRTQEEIETDLASAQARMSRLRSRELENIWQFVGCLINPAERLCHVFSSLKPSPKDKSLQLVRAVSSDESWL